MVFWHPKGWTLWQPSVSAMRRVYRDNGYRNPLPVLDKSLWVAPAIGRTTRTTCSPRVGETRFRHQPMNCPGRSRCSNSDLRSYHDLPCATVVQWHHRSEPSGALHGVVMRVRGFIDDGHFLPRAKSGQCVVFNQLAMSCIRTSGFRTISPSDCLATEKRIGSENLGTRPGRTRRLARCCGCHGQMKARSTGQNQIPHEDSIGRLPGVRDHTGRFLRLDDWGGYVDGHSARQTPGDAAPAQSWAHWSDSFGI